MLLARTSWSDEITAFVWGFPGCGHPTSGWAIPTRHFMATDSLVNVAVLHESPGVREEKVGVAMLCGCAGADAGSLV